MINLLNYNNYITESLIETDNIVIKESPGKGRGVYSKKNFKKDDLIEVCPVIIIPLSEKNQIFSTVLGQYVFEWKNNYALVLGNGSLYNHDSVYYNAYHENDYINNVIRFFADTTIKAGSEIMHNYGWE